MITNLFRFFLLNKQMFIRLDLCSKIFKLCLTYRNDFKVHYIVYMNFLIL